MNRYFAIGFAVSLLTNALTPTPAFSEKVPANLRACVDQKDNTARLACFDRAMAQLATLQPSPSAPAEPPASQLSPEERFGRTGVVSREDEKRMAPLSALTELTATVLSVSTRANGELVMKLDNGQAWIQATVDTHFSIAAKDKVKIRAGALRSFYAISPTGRTTKVVRLK